MSLLPAKPGRVTALWVVLTGFTLLPLFTQPAGAVPTTGWTKFYYSDRDFTNWVGEKSLWCDGSFYSEGQQTGYSLIVTQENCSTSRQISTCYLWYPPHNGQPGSYVVVPCTSTPPY